MKEAEEFLSYLNSHKLRLTTAESCTAGMIIALLADIPGYGDLMDCGYVVYSVESKRRLLNVKQATIDAFNLTSEEVAREMVLGALRDSSANSAIATTGVAGPDPVDGIAPGTICFGWGFQHGQAIKLFSATSRFEGNRPKIRKAAAFHAMRSFMTHHQNLLKR